MKKILLASALLVVYPLLYAVAYPVTVKMVRNSDIASLRQAIISGADVNAIVTDEDNQRYSLLMVAARSNALAAAQLLIDNGANVNQDVEGVTALACAIDAGSVEMVALILDHGAVVNPPQKAGKTFWPPLSRAAGYKNNPQIVRLLIERGADVKKGKPLHEAVGFKSLESAKMLIEHGANVNEEDSLGSTPLLVAIQSRSYDMVRLLLENGARAGSDAVELASYDKQMVDILRQHGVKIGFFQYAVSRIGSGFAVFLLVSLFFVCFILWSLKKNKSKADVFSVRLIIRFFGLLFILLAFPHTLGFSMGRTGTPPWSWYMVILSLSGLFISGFGVLFLKKWSWYSATVFLAIYLVSALFDIGRYYFFECCVYQGLLFVCLLIPSVKAQFR